MNIKSADMSEHPAWINQLKPTDIKWLNGDKTAALCAFSDSRYRIKVVCKDDKIKGANRCIEVASTQEKGVELERVEKAFDEFEPSKETESMSPAKIAELIRNKIAG